jgi:hypothetical protein
MSGVIKVYPTIVIAICTVFLHSSRCCDKFSMYNNLTIRILSKKYEYIFQMVNERTAKENPYIFQSVVALNKTNRSEYSFIHTSSTQVRGIFALRS